MTGFQHLSVRLKILSVAGLGIFLFLAYFLYSYYIAETNIDHLRQVESHDFPVLELVNANNVEFLAISDAFDDAISQAHAFYSKAGATGLPELMSSLGEVEYCQGVAALCDSGTYGACRVCAAIIGTFPGLDKMDGFDVGMNISGIILFPLALLLVSFPFWIGNIDVSGVGPPPTS